MDDSITIRKLTEEDAAGFLALGKQLDTETKFMLFEPGERDWSADRQKEIFKTFLGQPTNAIFLAFADDKNIGYVGAEGSRFRRIRHVITISIGVLQAYQRRGIGKRLMAAIEEWAAGNGIHRINCHTLANNQVARRLYERLGYEQEGLRRHAVTIDGNYVDEICMAKLLL